MKINNSSPPSTIQISGRSAAPAKTQEQTASAVAGSTSSVGQANAALTDTTHDIDSLRLNEVKQAIIDGKLEIDSSKIAAGLLANLRGV